MLEDRRPQSLQCKLLNDEPGLVRSVGDKTNYSCSTQMYCDQKRVTIVISNELGVLQHRVISEVNVFRHFSLNALGEFKSEDTA